MGKAPHLGKKAQKVTGKQSPSKASSKSKEGIQAARSAPSSSVGNKTKDISA